LREQGRERKEKRGRKRGKGDGEMEETERQDSFMELLLCPLPCPCPRPGCVTRHFVQWKVKGQMTYLHNIGGHACLPVSSLPLPRGSMSKEMLSAPMTLR
jgi:hypothetical protein